jgi:hypothetical protein
MNERLSNYELPSPLDNIVFENDAEREQAEYLKDLAQEASGIYRVQPDGACQELNFLHKTRWADIARVGVNEDGLFLYLNQAID